jgi:hypothetical protein
MMKRSPAFTILEVVLYIACVMCALPIMVQSVRLVIVMGRQCRAAQHFVLHRRAYHQLWRDATGARIRVDDHGAVVMCREVPDKKGRGAFWQVCYQFRCDGLCRQQTRVLNGEEKKSSIWLAPLGAQVSLQPCLIYMVPPDIKWHYGRR